MKVFEAFSGYGSQSIALRNLGIRYEVVAISEIDKYAITAYESIHGKTNNLGDISKVDVKDVPQHDLFTYSFPCQDISVSGKTKGIIRGETRSGLLYECERIIEYCRPKYLLMENVKNLVGKKFKPQFDEWLKYLEGLGYTNYWQVLNAKDYGIPQNRERVFVVSILGDHKPYKFPTPIKLNKRIKDILEDNVSEKYYLSEEIQKRFKMTNQSISIVGTTKPEFRTIGQRDLVYSPNGVMGALVATDYKQPKQIIEYKGEQIELPCIAASRGRNPENPSSRVSGLPTEQRLEVNTRGLSNTLTTVQKDNYVLESDKILKVDIPQIVRKRKYEVNIEKLKKALKEGKAKSKLSNKEISNLLNKPLTLVEHWFRNDNSFSIPSEDIWFELKKILNITSVEFDESITTFEEKEGVYEKSNRCYFVEGIAPTLTCGDGEKIIEQEFKIRKLGVASKNQNSQAGQVVSVNGVSMTICAGTHGYAMGYIADEYEPSYRIRKLTPKECFRLMGLSDDDIDKIQATGISDTQQYKMAGNSIVVPVLEGIFRELFL